MNIHRVLLALVNVLVSSIFCMLNSRENFVTLKLRGNLIIVEVQFTVDKSQSFDQVKSRTNISAIDFFCS